MSRRKLIRLGVVALAAASLLGGCGRKGPLELPPGSPPSTAATDTSTSRAQPLVENPGLIQPPNRVVDVPAGERLDAATHAASAPINAPKPPPARPFVLDPLL